MSKQKTKNPQIQKLKIKKFCNSIISGGNKIFIQSRSGRI